MYRFSFFLLCFLIVAGNGSGQITLNADSLPKIFGPGVVSDGFANRDMAISPSGNQMLYTLQFKGGKYAAIVSVNKTAGKWSSPEIAWFSGKYNDLEASFAPDGKRIYFSSNRPVKEGEQKEDYDIWYIEKNGDTWSEPINAGSQVNSGKDEYYPYVTNSGNLYFTRDNGKTKDDIFVAVKTPNGFSTAEALSLEVNSAGPDFNAYVDPEETFIIFSSFKRSDDTGGGDLYISLRKEGVWQVAKNLGTRINSSVLDYSPFVSYDQKYFFFTSRRSLLIFPFSQKKNLRQAHTYLTSFGNGEEDIYFMKFEELKKIFFK
jgi:Tol biopolymer transport system component